jgi:hypothetical protein
VNGQVVVKEGRLTKVDEDVVVERANASSGRLLELAHLHTGKDFLSAPTR